MLDLLFAQYKGYSFFFITLEITAVVFGIISVLFARKNNILVYPVGTTGRAYNYKVEMWVKRRNFAS